MSDAAQAGTAQPGARRQSRRELEFLPAALEIVETPASPVGRAVAGTIIAAFVVALAWACLGSVDVVATAAGKVIPTGRTKVIQPLEIGVVRAIRVAEGQQVRAGDVLIELDPTASTAERDRLASDLLAARLEVARLDASLADGDPEAAFAPPPAPEALVRLHRQLLVNQMAEHRARLASLDRQHVQLEAERAAVEATAGKLAAVVPLLRQRVDAKRYLSERGSGSRLDMLELQQELVEAEHELQVQHARLREAEAALAALAETRRQTDAEFRRTRLTELADADRRAGSLAQELVKAEQRSALQVLTAPVDGVVQQLDVHTVGGVVTPAQELMVIVPADSSLEVEAMVLNRDIGFVEAGQDVEVKIDTFNFTKYGLIPGTVLHVSPDAVPQDPSPARPDAGDGFAYAARIALDRTHMEVEGREVALVPGMAVTAEIRTGSRRIIEFLLSPVLRYRQESLRER